MYISCIFHVYLNRREFHFLRLHINKTNQFCFLINNGRITLTLMFKMLPKKISNWNALCSNRKHFNYLCTINKRFKEKNFISFREIVRERFSTFRFREQF